MSHTCPICGADTPAFAARGMNGPYYRDCPSKDDERHALTHRAWRHGLVARYMGESSEDAARRLRDALPS